MQRPTCHIGHEITHFWIPVQAKKLKEEEERSKEQRKASLAASRRPSLSAPGGAPSAAGEAATPSGARKGMADTSAVLWPML